MIMKHQVQYLLLIFSTFTISVVYILAASIVAHLMERLYAIAQTQDHDGINQIIDMNVKEHNLTSIIFIGILMVSSSGFFIILANRSNQMRLL